MKIWTSTKKMYFSNYWIKKMEAGVIPGYIILKVLASEPSHNSTYPPVTLFLALTATFQINCPH